jgi:hypothetical protein
VGSGTASWPQYCHPGSGCPRTQSSWKRKVRSYLCRKSTRRSRTRHHTETGLQHSLASSLPDPRSTAPTLESGTPTSDGPRVRRQPDERTTPTIQAPLAIRHESFVFQSPDLSRFDTLHLADPFHLHVTFRRACLHSAAVVMWSMPDSMLQPSFTEEDLQLLHMCTKLLHTTLRTREPRSLGEFTCTLNSDLLLKAIGHSIFDGNVDAARELMALRFIFSSKRFSDDFRISGFNDLDYDTEKPLVQPLWYLFAARNDVCHMLRCLTELSLSRFRSGTTSSLRGWRKVRLPVPLGGGTGSRSSVLISRVRGLSGWERGAWGVAAGPGGDASSVSMVCYSVVR